MRSKHSNFQSEGPVNSRSTIARTVHASQIKFGHVFTFGNVSPEPFFRRETNGGPTEKQPVWYAE
jgi:hypothetical protein